MIKSLTVWWAGAQVGVLRIDEHGDLAFAYAEAWLANPQARAISFSLPKQSEPFNRRQTRPFFAGLLPDEGQRETVAQALGVSAANDFRLLEQLGGDIAGALSLWPEGETPPAPKGLAATEPLDDDALVEVLDLLPRRPFLAGDKDVRLSLAGAQQKLPVVLINGKVAVPAPGQPSTHILKPPITRFSGTTENEAFAMRLAAALKLKVAAVEPRRVRDRPYLLIERYDRVVAADGRIERRHQEDFCQALGVAPEHKYAAEGGPIFRDCFALVRQACTLPAPATLGLVDAAIFNVLVGNADAHGKNFSLLYQPGGIVLAPLYDLMCTAAYPEIHARLAMKVGHRARLEEFTPDTWDDFAGEVGVGATYVRRRAGQLAEQALAAIPAVTETITGEGFAGADLSRFAEVVSERAKTLLAISAGERQPRPRPVRRGR